uniref:Uncharacterized protein n=1 Tax=uncultured marine virus TaxID=186617 RepID=A0A0F7L6T1_9VIRU|nr:hypothetical protein [uncultured marine virus]
MCSFIFPQSATDQLSHILCHPVTRCCASSLLNHCVPGREHIADEPSIRQIAHALLQLRETTRKISCMS